MVRDSKIIPREAFFNQKWKNSTNRWLIFVSVRGRMEIAKNLKEYIV